LLVQDQPGLGSKTPYLRKKNSKPSKNALNGVIHISGREKFQAKESTNVKALKW
jgi:hypothetical protein